MRPPKPKKPGLPAVPASSLYRPGPIGGCRRCPGDIGCFAVAGTKTPLELRRFVALSQNVEAVLQRCGQDTFDLILLDVGGNWTRWVFPSRESAEAAVSDLEVPLHDGWDDRMVKRINKRDHWNQPGGQRRAL